MLVEFGGKLFRNYKNLLANSKLFDEKTGKELTLRKTNVNEKNHGKFYFKRNSHIETKREKMKKLIWRKVT